ncbi:MAG: 4-(cytidine 5'-diphospho)-2-C-methyl-D-erythritol kinase [bacterium]
MVLCRLGENRYEMLAPAKINLTLSVYARRPDGYHNLHSVMQAIDFCDRLTFRLSPQIELACGNSDLPTGRDNLVIKAAKALQERTGSRSGISVFLEKRIPQGAGLGGGSSDAAATLAGLNKIWDLGLSAEELGEIGARLGADIPFFIRGGTMLAEGIGERLTPLPTPDFWVLLTIFPHIRISTPWAYREGDRLGLFSQDIPGKRPDYRLTKKDNCISITSSNFSRIAGNLQNDFEQVVFPGHPELEETKRLLMERDVPTLLSGSGSTLFSLFGSREKAGRTREALINRHKPLSEDKLIIAKTLSPWGVDKR